MSQNNDVYVRNSKVVPLHAIKTADGASGQLHAPDDLPTVYTEQAARAPRTVRN